MATSVLYYIFKRKYLREHYSNILTHYFFPFSQKHVRKIQINILFSQSWTIHKQLFPRSLLLISLLHLDIRALVFYVLLSSFLHLIIDQTCSKITLLQLIKLVKYFYNINFKIKIKYYGILCYKNTMVLVWLTYHSKLYTWGMWNIKTNRIKNLEWSKICYHVIPSEYQYHSLLPQTF